MTTTVKTLAAWDAAHQAQVEAMHAASLMLRDAEYSEEPGSAYQVAHDSVQSLARAGKSLAVASLKQIDAAIANGTVVADLTAAANHARNEAKLITGAAAKVHKLAGVVTAVTQVVGRISALPFV
jgi:hypothetical protein